MSDVKLLRLELNDFKGVSRFLFEPEGESAVVEGPNACGKSTLMTAFLWLLTGKDAQGRENYQIFPLQEDGSRMTGCSPFVKAELAMDGVPVVLTRQLGEKWSKTRGSAVSEYRGDETKCTIDETPTAITKYAAWVEENICPADLLPLLLNVNWFSEQTKDYQQRRALLLKQFGGISEAEILASNEQLAPLQKAMGRHSVDEFRKILQERRRGYVSMVETVPARIDENRKQLDASLPSEDEVRKERSQTEVQIRRVMKDLETSSASNLVNEAKEEEKKLKSEISSLDIQRDIFQREDQRSFADTHNRRLVELGAKRRQTAEDLSAAQSAMAMTRRHIDALNNELDDMRAQWVKVNSEQAQIVDTCPTCGRPLDPETIREAVDNWNLQKSCRLDTILQYADEKKRRLKMLESKETEQARVVETAEIKARQAEDDYNQEAAREAPKTRNPILEELAQRKETLLAKMEELVAKIANGDEAARMANKALQDKLDSLQRRSDELANILASIQTNRQVAARINELEEQRHAALADLEQTEQLLSLCQLYVRTMVQTITGQINKHFVTVRFNLFEEQKNGGLKEVCEATVDGVPYGSLNTAAKMQANVEIVSAFSQASGYRLPLFLDNRESVQRVLTPNGIQIINLQVSPIDRATWHKI